MARYQLDGSGLPLGQFLIPPGTVINTGDPNDGWGAEIARRGLPPPVTCQALDQATYEQMCSLYGSWRVAPLRT
jgi:hypothetical protein